MTNKQMAGQLGRSVSSLSVKLSALHITRDGNAKFNELDNKDLDEFQEAESVGRRVKELLNSPKTPSQPGCNFLTIDFTNHGDLYDRFLSFVESEFRTPENEILFLISKVLRYHDDKDQI